MEKNFELATRHKIRFSSNRGELSLEQLWDVPLRSRDNFNLDVIARQAKQALEAASEESFVDEAKRNPAKARLEVAFDIVKYVISVKLEEERKAKTRAENREKREKLLKILAEKQENKLSDLSEKELRKQIDALGEEE